MRSCWRDASKNTALANKHYEPTNTPVILAPPPSRNTRATTATSDNRKTSGPEPFVEQHCHSSRKPWPNVSCRSSLIRVYPVIRGSITSWITFEIDQCDRRDAGGLQRCFHRRSITNDH